MREIKFRVWDNLKKSFLKDKSVLIHTEKPFVQHDQGHIFQQYTGLKDKNGKEIYEGDIVKFDNSESNWKPFGMEPFVGKAEIIWCSDFLLCNTPQWGLSGSPDKDGYRRYYGCMYGEIEVIGNIFENKDLLK